MIPGNSCFTQLLKLFSAFVLPEQPFAFVTTVIIIREGAALRAHALTFITLTTNQAETEENTLLHTLRAEKGEKGNKSEVLRHPRTDSGDASHKIGRGREGGASEGTWRRRRSLQKKEPSPPKRGKSRAALFFLVSASLSHSFFLLVSVCPKSETRIAVTRRNNHVTTGGGLHKHAPADNCSAFVCGFLTPAWKNTG